jgi:hypothetical protein
VKTAYHPPDPYLYQAAVVRVVTPATFDLQIDVGFRMSREVRVQLRGVDLPDTYSPDDGGEILPAATNWLEAAAVGATGDFPLWIRTYKHADPDAAEPGEDLYTADVVRKCDADNLRVHLTDKFPDTKNGVSGDTFDFFRGRGTTDADPDTNANTDTDADADTDTDQQANDDPDNSS